MADIALRVELYKPSAVGHVSSMSLLNDAKVANTSFPVNSDDNYTKFPTKLFNGSNGLVWADEDVLTFNDADELDNVVKSGGFVEDEQDPDEFFWGLTDANGNYEVKVTIYGSNIEYITVFGDTVNQQFPTEAYLNDSTTAIHSDDAQWVIKFSGGASNTQTIKFTKWNRPNYNAAITLIRVTATSYDLTPFNGLSDVSVHLQSNTNPQELEYGVVPNSGSFSMTDEGGEVEDLIREGMLPISNLPVDYYLNGNRKSRHITTDSDYSTDRTASASMTNNISNWGNIQFKGRAYTGTTTTMYKILFDVLKSTVFNGALTDTVFAGLFDHSSTAERLKNITTTYDYVEPNTLRQTIDNICNVAQITCYEVATADYPNNIRFANARPVYYTGQALYLVPERYQIEQPSKDIVLRNQYTGVEVQECQVTDVTEVETVVYNRKYDRSELNLSFGGEQSQAKGNSAALAYLDVHITAVRLNVYYVLFSEIKIPKKTNFNLTQIKNVYSGENDKGNAYLQYTLTGKKYTYNNSYIYVNLPSSTSTSVGTVTDVDKGALSSEESFDSIPSPQISIGSFGMQSSVSISDPTNNKTIRVDSSSDPNYHIIRDLKILVSEQRVYGEYKYTGNSFPNRISGTVEDYEYTSIELSFMGDKRTITFDDFEAKQSPNFATAKTIARIDENQLLTDRLKYGTWSHTATLMDYILTDYKDGIATAKVKVFCGDVYNTGGLKVRDWTKGETYEIGDLVQVDKDNAGHSEWTYQNGSPIVWKVTGLTHSYSGAPYIDLELQEVKPLT